MADAIDWAPLLVDTVATPTLLDMLKDYLGLTDGTNDAALGQALNAAGPFIETWLDRIIAQRETVDQYQAQFDTVALHNMPVVDPVVVTLDGTEDTTYSTYRGRGGITYLTRTGIAPDIPLDWRAFNQIEVTYTAGWDPLPVDLAQGIVWTAADIYKSAGTGSLPGGGGGGTGEISALTLYDVGSIKYDVGSSSGGDVGAGSGFSWGVGPIPDMAASIMSKYRRMAA